MKQKSGLETTKFNFRHESLLLDLKFLFPHSFVASSHICMLMVLSSLLCTFTVSVVWARKAEGVHVQGSPDQWDIKQDLAVAHLPIPLSPGWSKWRWPWAELSLPLGTTAPESSIWAEKFNYTSHEEGKMCPPTHQSS